MDKEFWSNAWNERQIGFHQSEINKNLRQFSSLFGQKSGDSILVPLCGKTLDMIYLQQLNFKIDGVEIVEQAIKEFFSENNLIPKISNEKNFTRYSHDDYSLYLGDFHQFENLNKKYKFVYDRASMIALPPELRKNHAQSLKNLTLSGSKILLITLEYDQEKVPGPPFSVLKSEVEILFNDSFIIQELKSESTSNIGPKFKDAGINKVYQRVYLLEKI